MKKKYAFLILLSINSFLGCKEQSKVTEGSRGMSSQLDSLTSPISIPLNMQDSMKTISLKLGEETTIQLNILKDYTWYYEVKPDWVISMTEPYGAPYKGGLTSDNTEASTDTKIFKIKTLKIGEATIRFYAIKAGEPNSKPIAEKFYTIKIQ
jgi:hypothetical protein